MSTNHICKWGAWEVVNKKFIEYGKWEYDLVRYCATCNHKDTKKEYRTT
jgi:hypothetical protein